MDKIPVIRKHKDVFAFSKPGISGRIYLSEEDLRQLQQQIRRLLSEVRR